MELLQRGRSAPKIIFLPLSVAAKGPRPGWAACSSLVGTSLFPPQVFPFWEMIPGKYVNVDCGSLANEPTIIVVAITS